MLNNGTGIFAEDSNSSWVLESTIEDSLTIGIDVLDDDQDIDPNFVSNPFIIDNTVIRNAPIGVQATEAAINVRLGSKIIGCSTCQYGILSNLGQFTNLGPTGGVEVSKTTISKFKRAGILINSTIKSVTIDIRESTIKNIGGQGAQTLGGIILDNVVNALIQTTVVRDVSYGYGIAVYCSGIVAILDNEIQNAAYDGILVQEQGGTQVCNLASNYGSHLISGNLSLDNGFSGIFVYSDDNNRILNNTARRNAQEGIVVLEGHDHTIQGNRSIENAQSGFLVFNAENALILENRAKENGDHGFDLQTAISPTITTNKSVYNTGWGFLTNPSIIDGGGNVANHNGGTECDPNDMSC